MPSYMHRPNSLVNYIEWHPKSTVKIIQPSCDLYDQLTEVSSLQHPDEGAGRRLEPINHVLSVANAAVRDQRLDLSQKVIVVIRHKLCIDKAADHKTASK